MRLITKGRAAGKTAQMIYASEVTGIPIATYGIRGIENIKMMAETMGCNIPEPITYYDLTDGRRRGNERYENVLVDDVDNILRQALNSYLNCNVVGATMTPRDDY